jgi:hypothetical protein
MNGGACIVIVCSTSCYNRNDDDLLSLAVIGAAIASPAHTIEGAS